jgi:hypothetical protein
MPMPILTLETLCLIIVAYGGVTGWPWWVASTMGAVVSIWNICRGLSQNPLIYRLELARDDAEHAFIRRQIFINMFTSTIVSVGLFSLIWFISRWLSH